MSSHRQVGRDVCLIHCGSGNRQEIVLSRTVRLHYQHISVFDIACGRAGRVRSKRAGQPSAPGGDRVSRWRAKESFYTCTEPRAPRVYGNERRERCYGRTWQGAADNPPKVKGSTTGRTSAPVGCERLGISDRRPTSFLRETWKPPTASRDPAPTRSYARSSSRIKTPTDHPSSRLRTHHGTVLNRQWS